MANTEKAQALLATAAIGAKGVEVAREAAKTRFLDMGPPTRRDEYWRFTDPARLNEPMLTAEGAAAERPDDDAFRDVDAATVVMENGRFRADLSDLAVEGVDVATFGDALAGGWARDAFGALETLGHTPVSRPFAALNSAMMLDGVAIRVHGRADRPIRIQHLGHGAGAAYGRALVRVETGAEATILESRLGPDRLNTVMEAEIADGGALHHARMQTDEHGGSDAQAATHLFARLGREARLKSFTLTAARAASLIRNEYVVWLDGDDAVAHLAGGVISSVEATVDNTIFLTHGAERCESRQVYKNVIADTARAVFQGKILVRPGAQKTDGYQISQSILLDDRASFQAKPELEIYADDVSCSHGSTTGALDARQLYYLRSRGVDEATARRLLVLAFVEEAILEIEDPALQDAARAEATRLIAEAAA